MMHPVYLSLIVPAACAGLLALGRFERLKAAWLLIISTAFLVLVQREMCWLTLLLAGLAWVAPYMGMKGAAIATALGSVASLITGMLYLRGETGIKDMLPKSSDIAFIFKISLASTSSSLITAFTVGMSFGIAGSYGTNAMASISVCAKVYSVAVSIASALAFSIQPFIGYNYGNGNYKRLLRGLTTSLCTGTIMCIAGAAFFSLGGELLMRIFTDDNALIKYGARVLRLMAVGLPVSALLMNCMSYLSGTGKAMRTLVVGLSKQLLVFVPVILIMRHFFGETGMMLAYPVSDIISTIPAVALCAGEIKKLYTANKK